MKKIILIFIIINFFMAGCSETEILPELLPLLKHGDFYVGINAEGKTAYFDFSDGELCVIGIGRTALEKYVCDTPKLLATAYDWTAIIAAGEQESGAGGCALGNLYITATEIIVFNFSDFNVMERISLKKFGVIRVSHYDVFIEKLGFLQTAVNDVSEYRVTIDAAENPVLYKDDRIVYYEGEYVFIKNVTGLHEEPISFKSYYESFVQNQSRIELLRRSNNLHDYICLVFNENICFISDSGHLIFSR